MEEIESAFLLFDTDKSGEIDIEELSNAMRSLGIYQNKKETKLTMAFADKDGSGSIEKGEFISLMAKIIDQKNQKEEIKKTFRFYDNDDDGKITVKNLEEAADILDMED